MSFCAPNVKVKNNYTCFTYEELKSLAEAFNNMVEQNIPICMKRKCAKKQKIKMTGDKRKLWGRINERLRYLCKREYCWIEQNFLDGIQDKFLREKLMYYTFKPKMTKTRYSWLDTADINNVLQQYHEIFNSFKFWGALPSDFYTKIPFKTSDLHKYNQVGIIFNLDTHDMPGSHWVAFLVDNVTKRIEYFDSTGDYPNKYISKFIEKIRLDKKLKDYDVKINTNVHQQENTECGVYSIYYIIHRLLGYTFEDISNHKIKDKYMNKFRDVIFRPRV
jgi:hypothetical protein